MGQFSCSVLLGTLHFLFGFSFIWFYCNYIIAKPFSFRKLPKGLDQDDTIQRMKVDYNDIVSLFRHEVGELKSEVKNLGDEKNKAIKERQEARQELQQARTEINGLKKSETKV